jgi:AraC-like DNA-binding protein
VLGEVRFDLARQLLAETQRDMGDIAQACAYSDATAFQRAFRRWAGVAPGAWRAQRRGGGIEVATPSREPARSRYPISARPDRYAGERA